MANVLKSPRVQQRSTAPAELLSVVALPRTEQSLAQQQVTVDLAALEQELVALRVEVDSARLENAELVRAAAEREQLAFDRGLSEGTVLGKRAAAVLRESVAEDLRLELSRTRSAIDSVLNEFEQLAIELTLAMLAKLVGEKFHATDFVTGLVKEQLKSLTCGPEVTVTLAAADFSDRDSLVAMLESIGMTRPQIRFDDAAKSGACIVDLGSGAVDASWHSQLARIYEAIRTEPFDRER